MAQQVSRAAAPTAELAAQSEKKVCGVRPLTGLRSELAEHIGALDMAQVTCTP